MINRLSWTLLILLYFCIFASSIMYGLYCKSQYRPIVYILPMIKTHIPFDNNKWLLIRYFEKRGSPIPEEMAKAVLITRSPRLLAAMSIIETNGNPAVLHTGYKNRHSGAWQVNPHYWGTVPVDASNQALQAEIILETFVNISKGDLVVGLNRYGGDTTDNYSKKVLAELMRVPFVKQ